MALGRSDIFFKLEIIKKSLKLAVILIAFRYGVFIFMAASAFALGPLGVIINAWPNKKLLDYTIPMQIKDVLPTMLICICEALVVFGVGAVSNFLYRLAGLPEFGGQMIAFLASKLMFQFILGLAVFFGLSWMFKLEPLGEYLRMGSVAISGRFPRLATAINKRFTI